MKSPRESVTVRKKLSGQRGVDLDDVDRPDRNTFEKGDKASQPIEKPSYRQRLENPKSMEHQTSESSMLTEGNDSVELLGAMAIPGIFSASRQGGQVNTHTRQSMTTTINFVEETGAEAIVAAHLVDDLEKQNRAKIMQEIYNEAEKAEIVDTKRQRKRMVLLACFCCIILLGAGVGVGLAVVPREADINNSVCGNSVPLLVGDTIRGSVGNADVSKITPCSDVDPAAVVKGRWFTFMGDGTSITLTTCLNTNFDSQISVYTGSSCASLDCVAFNDNSPQCCSSGDSTCNSQAAAVTISTDVGVNYKVFVHGSDVDTDAVFELSIVRHADVDEQCYEATNHFYNNGVQAEVQEVSTLIFDTFDPDTACQPSSNGNVVCTLDASNTAENDMYTKCKEVGGRYIVKDFSLNCLSGSALLQFSNLPDCVSSLCTDKWIDEAIINMVDQTIVPALEGEDISCEVQDTSWSDGVVP